MSIISYSLQLELQKSSALLSHTCQPLVRLKNPMGVASFTISTLPQSTKQVIMLPGEEKLLEINWVQILVKKLT